MRKLKLGKLGRHAGHGETRPVPFDFAKFHFADGVKLRPDAGTTAIEQKGSAAAHTRQHQKDRACPGRTSRQIPCLSTWQSVMMATLLCPLALGDIVKTTVSVKPH